MSATSTTGRAPLTEQLHTLLHLVGRGAGVAVQECSFAGRRTHLIPTSSHVLPPKMLELLEDAALALAFAPATDGHAALVSALWRPAAEFSERTDWRYAVAPAAAVAISDALDAFLPPTFTIDGGPTFAAGWALTDPTTERERVRELLRALARRLGSDATAESLDTLLLPLPGGLVRDWSGRTPYVARLVHFTPAQTYALEQIEAAVAGTPKGGRS